MTATTAGVQRMALVCVPTTEQDRAVEFYEGRGLHKRVDTPFGGSWDHARYGRHRRDPSGHILRVAEES